MPLADALMIDADDLDEVKNNVIRAFHACAMAAQDYAELALDLSMVAYNAAESGAPVSAAYSAYAHIPRLVSGAHKMVEATATLSTIACALHESTDDEANMAYAEHLINMSRASQVSAMIEATTRRMNLVDTALPERVTPSTRFNAEIFRT